LKLIQYFNSSSYSLTSLRTCFTHFCTL